MVERQRLSRVGHAANLRPLFGRLDSTDPNMSWTSREDTLYLGLIHLEELSIGAYIHGLLDSLLNAKPHSEVQR